MTKLSVNINKIATLRNSRGEGRPDLLTMALLIERLGADGITVHPRPDQRHVKRDDLFVLKRNLTAEFNVEGYPTDEFIDLMHEICPTQITLVPDLPGVLTSNAGFKFEHDSELILRAVDRLLKTGSRISLFIDPEDFLHRDVSVIRDSQAHRVELYTKAYADRPTDHGILNCYRDVAQRCKELGLGVNAGHDLSKDNLDRFLRTVMVVDEVSIGHALISDALVLGMTETMDRYLKITRSYATE